MVINNRPVSDNILRIISERGYKQSAVARKAGYSRQTFGYMSMAKYAVHGLCKIARSAGGLSLKKKLP